MKEDKNPILLEDLGMQYPTENSKQKARFGIYKCGYCGRIWETFIAKSLKSCGCLRGGIITHGLTYNRFYGTWNGMISRCNNLKSKQYKNYGARGIKVCEEWLDVRNFIKWAESTHPNIEGYTLDRIDVNGNYEPDNCRWADRYTQAINQRIHSNNTSGYVGINWKNSRNTWEVRVMSKGKRVELGTYKTIEEAVRVRDNYIIENNLPHKLSSEYKEKETNENI